jgi:hypothetical protein
VRQEADTNKDRKVDVWIYFKNSEQVRQDEDLNFNGKIDARYLFKDGQVTEQKRVAELAPDELAQDFSTIQNELSRKAENEKGEAGKSIVKATQEGVDSKPR